MRTSALLVSTVVGLALSLSAAAQQATPTPLTGNMALVSEYRLRGIDQTFGKPALQGGFDYTHESGLFLGNWNSNVNPGAGYPGSNLEMDFYGGYKRAFGDFGLDAGFIYYYYPGSDAGSNSTPVVVNSTGQIHAGKVDNKEVYLGGTWKLLSLRYFHSLGDYFSVPGTRNSSYLDFAATYDLSGGWGVNGHFGRLHVEGDGERSYSDWKVGVTKELSGWVFGASYVDTNAKGDCGAGQPYCFTNGNGAASAVRDAGRSTIALSISKSF